MTTAQWIAQGAALFSCLFGALSYLKTKKTGFLICQMLVSVFFALQYYLLWSIPAMCNNLVSLLKYITFYLLARRGKDAPLWVGILWTVIGIGFCVATWDGVLTLVPIVTSTLFTVAIMTKNPVLEKSIFIVCSVTWCFFNFIVMAYVSAAYSLFEVSSAANALVRVLREKHGKNEVTDREL